MLLHGNLCHKKSVAQKCCSGQVSTRNKYTLSAERETPNAFGGGVVWERSTPWITERDTTQTETERTLARLVTAHPWIAVCIKSTRVFACVIHVLNVSHLVVFPCWTHNSPITQHAYFAHGSGALVAPG